MGVEHNLRRTWRHPLRAPQNSWERTVLAWAAYEEIEKICYYPDMRIHTIARIQMRWKWDDVYQPQGIPNMYSPSLSPSPLPLNLRTPATPQYRCTWRPWSSMLRDAFGGRDRVISQIQSEAIIERVWRYSWRPRLSELRDALGGRNRASLGMHWEAVIERV